MILNLTQHDATKEQESAGVVDLPDYYNKEIKSLLIFDNIPTFEEMWRRSNYILDVLGEYSEREKITVQNVMIGGALFFMPFLEKILVHHGITPWYAFSKRDCIEENGVKKSIFKHLGFVKGQVCPESCRAIIDNINIYFELSEEREEFLKMWDNKG